jgi:hypothetical protein
MVWPGYSVRARKQAMSDVKGDLRPAAVAKAVVKAQAASCCKIAIALSDWIEFIEVPRRGFHVALGHLGLTITDLMASIKRAISPEMNEIPPMNTPAITSFGLGQSL